jgi:two-component system, OmpR family, sensor histidine kinase MprB
VSLRWRFAVGLGVITALVIGFVGVGAYVAVSDRLEGSVDDSLTARAAEVTKAASGSPTGRNGPDTDDDRDSAFTRPTNCPPAGFLQPAAAAQLVSASGTTTVCIEGGVVIPVAHDDREIAKGERETYLRTVVISGKHYRVITVPQTGGSALQIARGLGEVDDVLSSMRRWLLAIGGIGVAAAVLLGWVLARRTVRPVEELRATAEKIAATQDLAVAVPVGGPSEIASLGRSFTTMVDALGASRDEQQRLVSDASHELRTPLTSLRTNAELLGRADELTPAQHARVVEGIGLEVDELTHLVSELVELATDRSAEVEPIETVGLDTLAADVVERARRRTERDITLSVTDPVPVAVAPQSIARAISNLVDNACKYSQGPVEVVVTGTRVEVRDRGPGIAVEDRAHVFDRFYRSVTARTAPGSGLGLAIVQQAVQRHGGTVWATDRTDPDADGHLGAAVGFELPRAS